MNENVFCYACRTHHSREQMRPFVTRQGTRWRCLQSIQAARRAIDERDAFGRQQTLLNRETALAVARRSIAQRHRQAAE